MLALAVDVPLIIDVYTPAMAAVACTSVLKTSVAVMELIGGSSVTSFLQPVCSRSRAGKSSIANNLLFMSGGIKN
jgi:hypothetical protein